MDNRPKKGRPSGTGQYGCTTRVARVPSDLSNEELASLIEFRAIAASLCCRPSPFAVGSPRAAAYSRCQQDIRDALYSLGLSLEPIMDGRTNLPPI